MGWDAWYAEHLMKIQHSPMTDPNQLGARFGEFVANATRGAQFVVERGMVPWFDNAYIHFELDGATDIQAAYDILCGHHSRDESIVAERPPPFGCKGDHIQVLTASARRKSSMGAKSPSSSHTCIAP